MKYSIGDIVKLLSDNNEQNRYIIIATKKQALDKSYLSTLRGIFNIMLFEKLAENGVMTTPGYRYKICKSSDSYCDGLCVLEGKFIDIMVDDELAR